MEKHIGGDWSRGTRITAWWPQDGRGIYLARPDRAGRMHRVGIAPPEATLPPEASIGLARLLELVQAGKYACLPHETQQYLQDIGTLPQANWSAKLAE